MDFARNYEVLNSYKSEKSIAHFEGFDKFEF